MSTVWDTLSELAEIQKTFESAITNGNIEQITQMMEKYPQCSVSSLELTKLKEQGISVQLTHNCTSLKKVLSLNELTQYPSGINILMEIISSENDELYELAPYIADSGTLYEQLFSAAITHKKLDVLHWMYRKIGTNSCVSKGNLSYAQAAITTDSLEICEFLWLKGFTFLGATFSGATVELKLWALNKKLI